MAASVSELFDFLEQQETSVLVRHEVSLNDFTILRGSLRKIIFRLRESDDSDAITTSDQLRVLLSEWLTVPIQFDNTLLDSIKDVLGTPGSVQNRWGSDIGSLYSTAIHAAERIPQYGNHARVVLEGVIREIVNTGESLKIYCHRGSRQHFESIFEGSESNVQTEDMFLHSVRDYRQSITFGVLVKFGPLRTRGGGRRPDSLISAPRYRKLVQVVWAGCSDDPEFGYDPAGHQNHLQPTDHTTGQATAKSSGDQIKWIKQYTSHLDKSDSIVEEYDEVDELELFKTINEQREKRSAILLVFGEEYGMLYPPHSRVLSFDPGERVSQSIDLRMPAESLREGMFVIVPLECDADMGGFRQTRANAVLSGSRSSAKNMKRIRQT